MMSYPVTDRDHERLVHDLDLLTQTTDGIRAACPSRHRSWFPRPLSFKHSKRLATGGSGSSLS